MASRPSLMDCAAAAAWSVDALSPPAAELFVACSVLMVMFARCREILFSDAHFF